MARSKSKSNKQESSEPEEYEVERILAHSRDKKKGLRYHVKWVGYPESENSWEPADNVQADVLLDKYWKKKSPAEFLDRYEPGTHEYRKYLNDHPEAGPSSGGRPKKRAVRDEDEEEAAGGEKAEAKQPVKKARRLSASASASGSPAKKKQATKGAAAPPAKRVKKEAKQAAAADDEEDDDDDELAAADGADDDDDKASAAAAEGDEKDEEEEEDEEDLGEEVLWEDLPFRNKSNWEDEIEFVSTVDIDHEAEEQETTTGESAKQTTSTNGATKDRRSKKQKRRDKGPPVVRFQVAWRGDKRTHSWVPNEILKEHAAKPMLAFYELHLKFRGRPNVAEEEEDEAPAATNAAEDADE
ncbi:hypothetical protein BMF94_5447 [Rhodotorula taiwanensis]|uniref:Chromo domain-containing protein n=1 Tax=Rhodotorula taiwanensis TaxID=741276 RepID=A0A2S5B438_9BASI|nr:hypothetical protein BMF94_5447 [Rhodotorula taiwanensis]